MPKHRDSFLELYRIIVMMAIVAHHYVVNSGLLDGASASDPKVAFLLTMGAWGKVGINCFVLITGYFMCESFITAKKFFKLYFTVVFYSVVLNALFAITGYEPLSWRMILYSVFPIHGITTNQFVGAFLVFFLTIPALNVLVKNMTQLQHVCLLAVLVPVFTVLPFFPRIAFAYNHVEWFAILYLISSYFRKYPNRITENRNLWGWFSLLALVGGAASVVFVLNVVPRLIGAHPSPFYFLADSNKFSALIVSICFFLFFKPASAKGEANTMSKKITPFYSPVINAVASATFGVLVIHANSGAMIRWLWRDVCECATFFNAHDNVLVIACHLICCVSLIFMACVGIDLLRQLCFERPLMAKLFPEKLKRKDN